jgi:Flp pilus assembly protein TadB
MKWIIIILVVLAVLLAAALIWTATRRKKDQVARQRASELRSDAASAAAEKQEREARARAAQAEADRVRAEADKLEVRAHEERTSYDMTQAKQEDALREADRLDPDVDHRDPEYAPDLDGGPDQRGATEARTWSQQQSTGPADPVPPGPETGISEEEQRRHLN